MVENHHRILKIKRMQ